MFLLAGPTVEQWFAAARAAGSPGRGEGRDDDEECAHKGHERAAAEVAEAHDATEGDGDDHDHHHRGDGDGSRHERPPSEEPQRDPRERAERGNEVPRDRETRARQSRHVVAERDDRVDERMTV
jgi:hypothetical protein